MSVYSLSIEQIRKIVEEWEVKYKEVNLIDHVKYRIKSPKSIIAKMKKKNYDLNYAELIDKINDVAGIRIICPFKENVYIVRQLIMENPNIHILDEKDYIQNPKKSGYSSLHLIIEIPVETELGKVMDKIFSGKELGKGKGGISYLTKDEVSRIDLTRNAFIMALTKYINGDIWR